MENYFGFNIFMVSNKQYGIRLLIRAHLNPPTASAFPEDNETHAQVMNITDVDDKIILKARRNHLLSQFFASPPPPADVLDRVRHGILSATTKLQVRVHASAVRVAVCPCRVAPAALPPLASAPLQAKLEKLSDEKARAAAAAAAGSKSASKQASSAHSPPLPPLFLTL
jgi:hypothetical protein